MTPPPEPEPGDLLAMEYAFGLLEPGEAERAARRLSADEAFARTVETWRRRAAAMLSLPACSPRPSLWHEIARRTSGADRTSPRAIRQLRVWRAIAAATTALAAASIALLVAQPARVPVAPPPARIEGAGLALLTGDGPGAMAIGYRGARRPLTVIVSGLRLGGRAAQLWMLPPSGDPVSLGVLDLHDERAAVRILAGRPLGGGTRLAVSLEPPGGSPTGLPTGPVILAGRIEANPNAGTT